MMSPGAIHCSKPVQPPLPGMPPPEPSGNTRLPDAAPSRRQIQGRVRRMGSDCAPYATGGGKSTNVRVQRVDTPGVTEARTWGS